MSFIHSWEVGKLKSIPQSELNTLNKRKKQKIRIISIGFVLLHYNGFGLYKDA
jgi:hypothetical protein